MVRKRSEGTVTLVSRAISEGIQPNGFEEWLAKQPKDQVVPFLREWQVRTKPNWNDLAKHALRQADEAIAPALKCLASGMLFKEYLRRFDHLLDNMRPDDARDLLAHGLATDAIQFFADNFTISLSDAIVECLNESEYLALRKLATRNFQETARGFSTKSPTFPTTVRRLESALDARGARCRTLAAENSKKHLGTLRDSGRPKRTAGLSGILRMLADSEQTKQKILRAMRQLLNDREPLSKANVTRHALKKYKGNLTQHMNDTLERIGHSWGSLVEEAQSSEK
jgi:hypothetical protein